MSKTILGLVLAVLAQFVPAEEAQVVVGAIGIIMAWYGRFAAVDSITWYGLKK